MADKLSDIIKRAIGETSPETQKDIAAHPDTPGVIAKIHAALGLGQADVMTTPEQMALEQADPTNVVDATKQAAPIDSPEELARYKAISEMHDAALKGAETDSEKTAASKSSFTDMLKGVGQLITDQLLHGYKQATQPKEDK